MAFAVVVFLGNSILTCVCVCDDSNWELGNKNIGAVIVIWRDIGNHKCLEL